MGGSHVLRPRTLVGLTAGAGAAVTAVMVDGAVDPPRLPRAVAPRRARDGLGADRAADGAAGARPRPPDAQLERARARARARVARGREPVHGGAGGGGAPRVAPADALLRDRGRRRVPDRRGRDRPRLGSARAARPRAAPAARGLRAHGRARRRSAAAPAPPASGAPPNPATVHVSIPRRCCSCSWSRRPASLSAPPASRARAARDDDRFLAWVAVALTVAAFSRLNYVLFPPVRAQWVYAGDGFRVLFHTVLLGGRDPRDRRLLAPARRERRARGAAAPRPGDPRLDRAGARLHPPAHRARPSARRRLGADRGGRAARPRRVAARDHSVDAPGRRAVRAGAGPGARGGGRARGESRSS